MKFKVINRKDHSIKTILSETLTVIVVFIALFNAINFNRGSKLRYNKLWEQYKLLGGADEIINSSEQYPNLRILADQYISDVEDGTETGNIYYVYQNDLLKIYVAYLFYPLIPNQITPEEISSISDLVKTGDLVISSADIGFPREAYDSKLYPGFCLYYKR